jgi:hypothetical protein
MPSAGTATRVEQQVGLLLLGRGRGGQKAQRDREPENLTEMLRDQGLPSDAV